jgi:hypothetical protein
MDNRETKAKLKEPEVHTTKKELPPKGKITVAQLVTLKGLLTEERTPKLLEYFKVGKLEELTQEDFAKALTILSKKEGE